MQRQLSKGERHFVRFPSDAICCKACYWWSMKLLDFSEWNKTIARMQKLYPYSRQYGSFSILLPETGHIIANWYRNWFLSTFGLAVVHSYFYSFPAPPKCSNTRFRVTISFWDVGKLDWWTTNMCNDVSGLSFFSESGPNISWIWYSKWLPCLHASMNSSIS